MKALIVFYSETGNTKKLAHYIGEYLHEKGWAVDERWLQPKGEAKSFFGKCLKAFFHRRTEFESTFVVVSPYDLVCFGSPVWAMGPAPAMHTYLKECVGLMGKKVLLFATYGSGLGKDVCLGKMARIMRKKDARRIYTLSAPGKEMDNGEKIKEEIRKILV